MSLTADRLAVERAAEEVARAAAEGSFLVGGDPLGRVQPSIDGLQHSLVCQVAAVLLRRFQDTVAGQLPALEPLAAAADQLALPVLARLEACCKRHRAFQSAFSLAPLLSRLVAVAAQCCSFAVLDVGDAAVVLPLTDLMRGLVEVLSAAVLDRAERYRPLDAPRVAAAHQAFDALQGRLTLGLRGLLGQSEPRPARALAPLPPRPEHRWRNEELRQFWEARCAPKYDGAVPADVLSTLLLRHAGAEVTMDHREAVMRRLARLERAEKLLVAAAELDRCGAEVRRAGGLRAWVASAPLEGGPEAAAQRPGPVVKPPALVSTWGSLDTTAYRMTASSLSRGQGPSAPASARTTASAFFPSRDKATPADLPTSTTPRLPESPRWGRRPFCSTPRTAEASPLLDAVERNVLKASQRLVFGDKAVVDARTGLFGETPLHAAALRETKKHTPLASMLLERGADVHAEDRHEATPLHFAAAAGNREVARRLVAGGADVCKEDRWGVTPLHKAAGNGQVALVEMLLANGASANALDEWGSAPLHRAVARGQLAVAERLLGAGGGAADANAADGAGECPLHLAAARGDYALVKLLLEHGASAAVRSRLAGKLPEDCARERGHADVVTLLSRRAEWVVPRSTAVQVLAGS